MKQKTTKQQVLLAALCSALLLCGCSDKDSAADNTKQLKEMSAKIDSLTEKLDDLNKQIDSYGDMTDEDDISFEDDIHPIYDDTAVIEAYKSGDDSKLTDDKDKYILAELKKAIDELITDDMSEYDKEKAVYDYIFMNTQFNEDSLNAISEYEESDQSHTPYGFFHDHNVICVGDATTFKLFMDALDIECRIIHSTEQGEHAWDVVKIDGDWYHVDILFDGGFGKPAYSFFNVPDAVKEMGDYPWDREEDDIPECTSTKLCYICNNAEKLEDIYQLPSKLKELIDKQEYAEYYSLDIPEDSDAVTAAFQINSMLNSMISDTNCLYGLSAVPTDDGKSVCFGVSLISDELKEEFNYEGYDAQNGIDIDYEKLDREFSEQLGEYYNSFEYYDAEAYG